MVMLLCFLESRNPKNVHLENLSPWQTKGACPRSIERSIETPAVLQTHRRQQPDFLLSYGNLAQMKTIPGASRLPNGWGFFDMIGNVWEMSWTPPEPGAANRAPVFVGRGGAFGAGSFYARSALRLVDRDVRSGSRGIRLARQEGSEAQ